MGLLLYTETELVDFLNASLGGIPHRNPELLCEFSIIHNTTAGSTVEFDEVLQLAWILK
jgi:hypothetical protein